MDNRENSFLFSPDQQCNTPRACSKRKAVTSKSSDRYIPSKVSASAFEGIYSKSPLQAKKVSTYLNLLGSDSTSTTSSWRSHHSLDDISEEKRKNRNVLRFGSDAKDCRNRLLGGASRGKDKWLNQRSNSLLEKMSKRAITKESSDPISRKIPAKPYKMLELPDLQDDFYLQLLDWSSRDLMAVGLQNQLLSYCPSSNMNSLLHSLSAERGDFVCAVSFSQSGGHLAFTDTRGSVMILDVCKSKVLRRIQAHEERVGSLSWNGYCFATGSRDNQVKIFDVRQKESRVFAIETHKQEICGVKWSFDEDLLASGGNDNKVVIFSLKAGKEVARFTEHTAAVKALAWSPHKSSLLASGGGTSDRTIRLWDTQKLIQKDCFDSGSQVCCLGFAKNCDEIVSTHGYSLNQINLWRRKQTGEYQNLASLTGHSHRVLYLAMSPCGERIATASGDETLRFWKLWEGLGRKSRLELGTGELR